MLQNLLNNLPPALNKDPLPIGSLFVTCTNTAIIAVREGVMQIEGYGSYQLAGVTISQLAQTIDGLSGFTANVVIYGELSGLALIDGTYSTPCTIPVFTSPIWHMFRTVAEAFKQGRNDWTQALFQSTQASASGVWLDALGQIYRVVRETGEPDQLYAQRVFDFSLGVRLNNIAIQKILTDLGYKCTVDDVPGQTAFNVNVTLPTSAPQGFVYDTSTLGNLVNLLKAAGVNGTVALQGSYSDSVNLNENVSSIIADNSTIKYGSGRKWGQAIWN